jgi:SAM-dependent methyltransferase
MMFRKIKKLKEMLLRLYTTLYDYPTFKMSAIDKHIFHNFVYRYQEGHYSENYKEWTMKRINKILEIIDIKWFKGKRVLILGDGIGNFSPFFAELGCDVTVLEGWRDNYNIFVLRNSHLKNLDIHFFDLRNDFTKFGKFDLIINFGLIEAMDEIKNLLECCCKMSDNVLVETLVSDSLDKNFCNLVQRGVGCDTGLNARGLHPSPFYIEDFFISRGFEMVRCFTKDLNWGTVRYDWEHKNDKTTSEDLRRFWFFYK